MGHRSERALKRKLHDTPQLNSNDRAELGEMCSNSNSGSSIGGGGAPSRVHATWEGSVRSGRHWSQKRAQSAPSRRLPLTTRLGARASAKAQAAQLPSLVGPRLLFLGVPASPNVSMSSFIVGLPIPLSLLGAGSSGVTGEVGVWGGAGVGCVDRSGVGVGKAGGGGGDVVVA